MIVRTVSSTEFLYSLYRACESLGEILRQMRETGSCSVAFEAITEEPQVLICELDEDFCFGSGTITAQ